MKRSMVFILTATLLVTVSLASAQNWQYVREADSYIDLHSLEPLYDSAGFVGGMRFWLFGNPPLRFQVDCRTRTMDLLQVGDRSARQERRDYQAGTKGRGLINFMCEVVAEMNKRR